MEKRDLLTDVSIYLRETLAKEKLSKHAELIRKQLLQKLDFRESSPQAYIDMNVSRKGDDNLPNEKHLDLGDCYELLSDPNAAKDKEATELKELSDNNNRNPENNYYNVPSIVSTELKPGLISQSFIDNESKSPLISQSFVHNEFNPAIISKPLINNDVKPEISGKNLNKKSFLPSSFKSSMRGSVNSLKKDNSDIISESSSITNSISSKSDEVGEVLSISASALRYSAVKYGLLSRRENFFFMGRTKHYWAALLGQMLFIYSNEKDNKPVLEVNTTGYQARPTVLKESGKKDFSFEVFAPGKKTYQFIAESNAEMEQWVTAICQTGKINDEKSDIELLPPKGTVRQLPSLPLAQMLYDHPESGVRPVRPPQQQVYELVEEPNDDYYHYIQHQLTNDSVTTESESALYKNGNVTLNCCEEDDNMYYNLIPHSDSTECIYDVIPERREEISSNPIKRISQVIEKPKTECSVNDSKPTEIIIQDEIYELVN